MRLQSFVPKRFAAALPVGLIILLGLAPTFVDGVPSAAVGEAPVGLGTAGSFGVLAGAGVTNTGPTIINGDLGTCPTPAVTGSPVVLPPGDIHANDAVACRAKLDLTTAFNDAAGRAPTKSYAGPTELGGLTLTPGVYETPTSFAITGTLTLNALGDPQAVFIFQAGSTLITATDSRVMVINGADACNVFWQVGSAATLGVGSTFVGTILALDSIDALTNTTVHGRLLARNAAVRLDSNTVTAAVCATSPTSSTPESTAPDDSTPDDSTPDDSTPDDSTPDDSTAEPTSAPTTASTSSEPATTSTGRFGSADETVTTGPGGAVIGEVSTNPDAPVPTATLPATGSPIRTTLALAGFALTLGALAIRLSRTLSGLDHSPGPPATVTLPAWMRARRSTRTWPRRWRS